MGWIINLLSLTISSQRNWCHWWRGFWGFEGMMAFGNENYVNLIGWFEGLIEMMMRKM